MKSNNILNRTFSILHFVLYLFCEVPLQSKANGILGSLPQSSNSKSSIQSILEDPFNNNYEPILNVSELKKSQVSISINSGCPPEICKNATATGYMTTVANLTVKDTPSHATGYQWMWSVIGHPTIQAAITKPGNFLRVDWYALFRFSPKSLWKSIKYNENPYYSSAVMLTKLIEFNDTTKTGKLEDQSQEDIRTYDLKHFNWTRDLVDKNEKKVAIRLIGENYNNTLENTSLSGTINLTLSGYSFDGYGEWLPHLQHETRTNQFDIQLQQLKSDSGFEAPRFSIEFAIVSDCKNGCKDLNITKGKTTSLDDEHTPGIFSTDELDIPGINNTLKSFIQWRPIVYTTAHRELAQSTGLSFSDPKHVQNASKEYNQTLLYALYGPDLDNVFVNAINVTFGLKGDGYYEHTKYQAWTFTYGTGQPIRNGISGVIVLAITLMIGVTLLVSIVAIIICAAKRFGRQSVQSNQTSGGNAYQPLEQDQSTALDRFINRWIRRYSAPNE